jgi:hypothetical protein
VIASTRKGAYSGFPPVIARPVHPRRSAESGRHASDEDFPIDGMLSIWHPGIKEDEPAMATGKFASEKVTVRLPKNLVKAAQHWALDHETSLQSALTTALADFLRARRVKVEQR